MADEPEDLAEHRHRREAEEAARALAENAAWNDQFIEANKDLLAKQAFGDAFVQILRDVTRQQSQGSGGAELIQFFKMYNHGASFRIGELLDEASSRIRPPDTGIGGTLYERRKAALVHLAVIGLAYLIEISATDGFAKSRLLRREDDLERAIKDFQEAKEAYIAEARAWRPPPATLEPTRKRSARQTSPVGIPVTGPPLQVKNKHRGYGPRRIVKKKRPQPPS